MRVLAYGAAALLIELDDAAAVLRTAAALAGTPDVLEVVPAAQTVLLRVAAGRLADVRARVGVLEVQDVAPSPARDPVVLDVTYDGEDLSWTARELGLDPDGLVRAHTSGAYVVAFCGFSPGFAYLSGLDPALHVPRLADPRTRVPAGSVAIAGEYTGVYPRQSPGGWRLLGRTDAPLWDLARARPALLEPGTPVRFRAVQ